MPALLAYLVAITLLLGGGYGGLYVLTHPSSDVKTAQAAPTKAPAKKTAAKQIAEHREIEKDTDLAAPASKSVSAPNPAIEPDPPSTTSSEPSKPASQPAAAQAASPPEARNAVATSAPESNPMPASTPAASDAMAMLPSAQSTSAGATTKQISPKAEPAKSVERKSRKTRLAHRHDKPVMMTLRTIRYADGRLEQRLVPLSSSRKSFFGRSDWDDDPFD